MDSSLKIPPLLECVVTLPCEIFGIFLTYSCRCPGSLSPCYARSDVLLVAVCALTACVVVVKACRIVICNAECLVLH